LGESGLSLRGKDFAEKRGAIVDVGEKGWAGSDEQKRALSSSSSPREVPLERKEGKTSAYPSRKAGGKKALLAPAVEKRSPSTWAGGKEGSAVIEGKKKKKKRSFFWLKKRCRRRGRDRKETVCAFTLSGPLRGGLKRKKKLRQK